MIICELNLMLVCESSVLKHVYGCSVTYVQNSTSFFIFLAFWGMYWLL